MRIYIGKDQLRDNPLWRKPNCTFVCYINLLFWQRKTA